MCSKLFNWNFKNILHSLFNNASSINDAWDNFGKHVLEKAKRHGEANGKREREKVRHFDK